MGRVFRKMIPLRCTQSQESLSSILARNGAACSSVRVIMSDVLFASELFLCFLADLMAKGDVGEDSHVAVGGFYLDMFAGVSVQDVFDVVYQLLAFV